MKIYQAQENAEKWSSNKLKDQKKQSHQNQPKTNFIAPN